MSQIWEWSFNIIIVLLLPLLLFCFYHYYCFVVIIIITNQNVIDFGENVALPFFNATSSFYWATAVDVNSSRLSLLSKLCQNSTLLHTGRKGTQLVEASETKVCYILRSISCSMILPSLIPVANVEWEFRERLLYNYNYVYNSPCPIVYGWFAKHIFPVHFQFIYDFMHHANTSNIWVY